MSAIQRMIDEMQRRGYAQKTIADYSGTAWRLATYFGKCPSELTLEQLCAYQLHLAERKDISASYYNATVALQNKAVIYNLLFRAASKTLLEAAAGWTDLKARLGFFAVRLRHAG